MQQPELVLDIMEEMSDSDWLTDVNEAIRAFPGLRVLSCTSEERKIGGVIDIVFKPEGLIIDTYELEIVFPDEYPKKLPRVWETGGKIPREAIRHVFTDTQALCFMLMVEESVYCWRSISTLKFLNEVVVPRLADEYNVSNGGTYTKELPHNLKDACWEFYRRKFESTDDEFILRILKQMVLGGLPKGYEPCPCTSGKKFKRCHRGVTIELQHAKDDNAHALAKMTQN